MLMFECMVRFVHWYSCLYFVMASVYVCMQPFLLVVFLLWLQSGVGVLGFRVCDISVGFCAYGLFKRLRKISFSFRRFCTGRHRVRGFHRGCMVYSCMKTQAHFSPTDSWQTFAFVCFHFFTTSHRHTLSKVSPRPLPTPSHGDTVSSSCSSLKPGSGSECRLL